MTDILVQDAQELMEEMAKGGPTEEEFENARKYLTKHHHEAAVRNRDNLIKKLEGYMMKELYGVDSQTDYIRILEKIKRKDIKKMAKKIVKGDSMLSVYTEK